LKEDQTMTGLAVPELQLNSSFPNLQKYQELSQTFRDFERLP